MSVATNLVKNEVFSISTIAMVVVPLLLTFANPEMRSDPLGYAQFQVQEIASNVSVDSVKEFMPSFDIDFSQMSLQVPKPAGSFSTGVGGPIFIPR